MRVSTMAVMAKRARSCGWPPFLRRCHCHVADDRYAMRSPLVTAWICHPSQTASQACRFVLPLTLRGRGRSKQFVGPKSQDFIG